MKSLAITFAFILPAVGGLCSAQDVPVLNRTDLPSATIGSTKHYAGKALYGYIDGGAELYLEYKFDRLGRQEIRFRNEKIVLEVYQMQGAYEAYGIFSVQRSKCVPVDSANPHTCVSRYQLQAVLGKCYVSIANETGSREAQQASLEIFYVLRSKITPQAVAFPPLFSNARLKPHLSKIVVAFGPLGVQNAYDGWDSLFKKIPRFVLSVLPIERESDHCALANIRFGSASQSLEFCRAAGFADAQVGPFQIVKVGEGMIRALRRVTETEILFGETAVSFPERDIYLRMLKR